MSVSANSAQRRHIIRSWGHMVIELKILAKSKSPTIRQRWMLQSILSQLKTVPAAQA